MQEIKKTEGMINFKRAKHLTAHTTPESAENMTDFRFTLTQIRLCQHVCMTQWNTGIFREIYIKLYRVALQGIWNKKFHITSWIQLVLSCSLGFSLHKDFTDFIYICLYLYVHYICISVSNLYLVNILYFDFLRQLMYFYLTSRAIVREWVFKSQSCISG